MFVLDVTTATVCLFDVTDWRVSLDGLTSLCIIEEITPREKVHDNVCKKGRDQPQRGDATMALSVW